jgi:hypothetical protein
MKKASDIIDRTIRDDTDYTKEDLRVRGIGNDTLMVMRRSGLVKAYTLGRFDWYDGAEVRRYRKSVSPKGQ